MPLTVLVAPSGLKECLSARQAAEAIAIGVRRAWPTARVRLAPIADGGEGFATALVEATRGHLESVSVTGPTGTPVVALFGFLGGTDHRTLALDVASAAGLALIPSAQRNPALTTSSGVGELIRNALDCGAERIVIGCGDSGVNDGGAGLIQALGARLLDNSGREIGHGGAALADLARIELAGLDPRLARVEIHAAVNPHNNLLGPSGVTRVYGPQKGARPEDIERLESALANYAALLETATGVDVATMPGAGASGGIGAGLAAVCGAKLHPRFDLIMHYSCFDRMLPFADLVLTADGTLDYQTPYGKVPSEVGQRAAALGIPVIALAGAIGEAAESNLAHGIVAYKSILTKPCTLADASAQAETLLANGAEHAVRMVGAGLRMAKRLGEELPLPECCGA